MRRMSNLYRYLLFRAKAQFDRCLAIVDQNPRARLILVAALAGLTFLVLRKLGEFGWRLVIGVRLLQLKALPHEKDNVFVFRWQLQSYFFWSLNLLPKRQLHVISHLPVGFFRLWEPLIRPMLLSRLWRQETQHNIDDGYAILVWVRGTDSICRGLLCSTDYTFN